MKETFTEIIRAKRNRPSGLLLDTAKVNALKKARLMSDEDIARSSGRSVRIILMTRLNQATGYDSQQAIASALGVPLEDILLLVPVEPTTEPTTQVA